MATGKMIELMTISGFGSSGRKPEILCTLIPAAESDIWKKWLPVLMRICSRFMSTLATGRRTQNATKILEAVAAIQNGGRNGFAP